MATKRTVETLPTFKELKDAMDEHYSTVEYIGPLSTDEETAYLAEEEGEMKTATKPKKSNLRKPLCKKSRASNEPVDNPSLTLLPGKGINLEDIRKMFVKLTGREPTKEDLEKAKAKWEKAHPASS